MLAKQIFTFTSNNAMFHPSLELTPIEGSEDLVGAPDTDGD